MDRVNRSEQGDDHVGWLEVGTDDIGEDGGRVRGIGVRLHRESSGGFGEFNGGGCSEAQRWAAYEHRANMDFAVGGMAGKWLKAPAAARSTS